MNKSITQANQNDKQISKSIKRFFTRFHVSSALKASNAYKKKGIPVTEIFQYLFLLIFSNRSMYMNLLTGRNTPGFAKDTVYHILGTYWEGLEKMLLSSSASVRGQVSYILHKHTKFDIVAYYIERLETPQKKICILGIGEWGSAENADMLLKYLDDFEARIVKSTLHAVSKLLGTKADEVFWKYLQDERPVVQRAAYREVAVNNIVYGAKRVYELFVQTESPLLKEKLAYQLLRERSWDRLPYILRLFWYEEEAIRKVIQRGVFGRSVYGKISKEDAEIIREILYDEKYCIPEHLQKSIEFDLKFVVK